MEGTTVSDEKKEKMIDEKVEIKKKERKSTKTHVTKLFIDFYEQKHGNKKNKGGSAVKRWEIFVIIDSQNSS